MPYVFDYSQIPQNDDDDELPKARLDQFQYLLPPAIGGVPSPVHFADPSRPAVASRSFMQRLFGGTSKSPSVVKQDMQQEERRDRFLSIVIPAFREAGVVRVYFRYDGGSDEGFVWVDRFELRDGQRLSFEAMSPKLLAAKLVEKLEAADVFKHWQEAPAEAKLRGVFDGWLDVIWADMLLGQGFGTGEFSMYGAFTVDLDACTITDDPNAEPIVQNITISKS